MKGSLDLQLMKIIKKGWSWKKRIPGFDPEFYLTHYADLGPLRTYEQARAHYLKHGKAEGRYPNEDAYLEGSGVLNDIKSEFDVVAYRFYNKDLALHFSTEEELFRHYVRNGRKERRMCRFPEGEVGHELFSDAEKWKSAFSLQDFLAWCGHELETLPRSREEGLAIFLERGIEQLWPINLEYAFDIDFFRAQNALQPEVSDSEAYRMWLTEGFPEGISPNEQHFLAPYLQGFPFPLSFHWQTFAKTARLPHYTTRSRALIAFFDQAVPLILRNLDCLGADAPWLLDRIARRALAQGSASKAAALIEKAVGLEPTADRLSFLGETQQILGSKARALPAYAESILKGGAPLTAFLNAATIQADNRDFTQAFATLRQAHPMWRQKNAYHTKVREIVQLYFEHESARAHDLYQTAITEDFDAGIRASADSLITDALDQIRTVYLESEALPAPVGGRPNGYVAILANHDLRQCTYYRVEQKIMQFEQSDIPVKVFSRSDIEGFIDSLIGARAAIFYRVPAIPSILYAILYAKSMNLHTYYEVDDLIFDSSSYPDPLATFEGQISAREYAGLQFGVPLFRYALSVCEHSIASTPALLDRMQAVAASPSGIVLRNGLDLRSQVALAIGAYPLRSQDGPIRIFYGSGTKAHNADFNTIVAPALLSLMLRHPHVELVLVGHLKLRPEFDQFKERIRTFPFTSDVTAYLALLASCHINLAVLEPGAVADCKSEIKWLEAAILQVPSIVSGTKTYRDIISNGVDGLIANSDTEWQSSLDYLVTNRAIRKKIGAAARAKALQDYNLDVTAEVLRSEFARKHETAASSLPPRKLRLLICNVFFAPQSYGGATRVVEDNVRDLAAQYPDLEIAVFCSDEGGAPAGRLRMYSEGSIPVYRLSTPENSRMDWAPFNEDNAAPFERVLDHFRPDLIHFHCIQRLTATIAEVAIKKSIPYVVTLHDGWWISDDQFFVGKDGLQLPSCDPLSDQVNQRALLASVTRRQRLAALLRNAEARLSVSVPFARIYEEAGIPEIDVIENGAPAVKSPPRVLRKDGRVALGHLGGRSAHKGAALLEATLRRGRFSNLHLTMVDGTLAAGQSIETIWGTTPVTLIAPYPQAEVGCLYARLNVLLAPSIWPESFGLVAREASINGLWVIASELGAVGQDVEDGWNGCVINVSTTKGLSEALSKIDAEPNEYRTSPPGHRHIIRSRADQALELYYLYHEIIRRVDDRKDLSTFSSSASSKPI